MVFLGHQALRGVEVIFFFPGVLGIEPRALCMLTKGSTTELHPCAGGPGPSITYYVAQVSLELVAILLLQTPSRWNCIAQLSFH